jgi:hypothetical protein
MLRVAIGKFVPDASSKELRSFLLAAKSQRVTLEPAGENRLTGAVKNVPKGFFA